MMDLAFMDINNYLRNHNSLIFPTETVYGLGCDAMSDEAIYNLLQLTFRPQEKGITTLCDSIEMIESYAEISFESERKVMAAFMPGPLTLILKSKHVLSSLLEQSNGTIGVRIPDNEFALSIIRQYGNGLATKSANITGGVPPTNANMIDPYFVENDVMVVDGGACLLSIASTIVSFVSEEDFLILREGVISRDEIESLLSM